VRKPKAARASDLQVLKDRSRQRRETNARLADVAWPARGRNDLAPALSLVTRSIDSLSPPKRDIHKSDAAHIRRIAVSIQQLGWCAPILINEAGDVVDGVSRLKAAAHAGLTDVSCIVVSHLNAAELKALRIALNKLAQDATWDFPALKL